MTKKQCPEGPALKGDAYAVPLDGSSWAVVLVAAANGKGTAFGYFFGPRLSEIPTSPELGLKPEEASLIGMFGDLGVCKGEWKDLGPIRDFDENKWRVLPCLYEDKTAGKISIRRYDPVSLAFIGEERALTGDPRVEGLPPDGMMGYLSAQRKLAMRLP